MITSASHAESWITCLSLQPPHHTNIYGLGGVGVKWGGKFPSPLRQPPNVKKKKSFIILQCREEGGGGGGGGKHVPPLPTPGGNKNK